MFIHILILKDLAVIILCSVTFAVFENMSA